MLASILPLHTLDPWVVSKCQLFFFFKSSRVAYQVNGNEAENTMQANFKPFNTPRPLDVVKRSKHFFEESPVEYQIKRKEALDIMEVKCLTKCTPLTFFGLGNKVRHCTDKNILIEINELIRSGYDLSDTQD